MTARPLARMDTSQATIRAGASDGAQATIAANNSAAEADADQDRAAA